MPDADDGYRLSVADDGHGLPDDPVVGSGPGFGPRPVSLLASQLGAWFGVRSGCGAPPGVGDDEPGGPDD
jgi:hypothetical protein